MTYDTAEIRRVARRVGNVASEVGSIATADVGAALNMIPGNFEGEAATVLQEELTDFRGDLKKLQNGLKKISNELLAYARRLEEADRAAATYIKSNG